MDQRAQTVFSAYKFLSRVAKCRGGVVAVVIHRNMALPSRELVSAGPLRHSKMRLGFALGAAVALATLSSAHTVFTTLFIDDVNQGDGTCVRMPKDPNTCTDPVESLTSQDMACGRDGETAVKFSCPAPAGAKLTFEFREWANLEQPGAIDASHKGPCAVYLKPMGSMATDAAAGPGWFKIWDAGYDAAAGRWCTEQLIANNGLLSVALPAGVPTGYYLVRPELLALQEAENGDPQFYVGCAQLFIQGQQTAATALRVPAAMQATIPGDVAARDPSVTFNIYAKPLALPYTVPGPRPFAPQDAAARRRHLGGGSSRGGRRDAGAAQTEGAVPAGCLLKNANWCGAEVPAYTDEAGCWAASDDCYKQQAACYDAAPPTGSKGCDKWGTKCDAIQAACGDGRWVGPPGKGQKLGDVEAPVPGPIPPVAAQAQGG
ncbi:hypothetical protein P8C59_001370 [Phyllachora maydis]|uniref:lytic cellulose monooxygenase (C4-dehydrogenating) n=1 Tax=Phyllachora maydis TaxID=1825666 RepID=A0AAD9HY18_9PEZI|nr:hypothetical protein P8C59_001370 [Phyllachora maydis]